MLELRYYQRQAVDSFFEYTSHNWGKHPVVVLPTAAGKSLVQAHIVKNILDYEGTRILLLTHQQELIKQNYAELLDNMDHRLLDIGVYSAGLKRRDTKNRILFAGIQSVYKKAWHLGFFDVILIDECHLIPHKGEGMYRTFLSEMEKINPNIVIGGLSATPYRLKDGLLTEGDGALFDAICHETSIKELINPFDIRNQDKQQFLCELTSKSATNKVDLTGVHIRGGEYIPGEMEKAFQANDLVCRAVKEIIDNTHDRKKVLIFTAGIAHCEEVYEKMESMGATKIGIVHSKRSDEENQQAISDFKNGFIKYLINVNVLTTGFNEKAIDCIILLRSTMSPGLYYQMAGRGLRMHPDKTDCLIMDFGKNIERHGPIDKITVKKKKDGSSEVETAPMKECPNCGALLFLSVMQCLDCGYEFPQKDKHDDKASEAEIISKWKKPKEYAINSVKYFRHEKPGKPDSLRVDYYTDSMDIFKFSEWVCIEHGGFAGEKARRWINRRTGMRIKTVDEALEHCSKFLKPEKIIVDENGKYDTITGHIFGNVDQIKNEEKNTPWNNKKDDEKSFDEKVMELL